jgi:hypothetical protein
LGRVNCTRDVELQDDLHRIEEGTMAHLTWEAVL